MSQDASNPEFMSPKPPSSELDVLRKYPSPDQLMHDFARQTMQERSQARAFSNTHTPLRRKVEDTRSSTPGSPHFNQPRKKSQSNNRNDKREIIYHKPFPFALEYDTSGARIYYGELLVAINQVALTVITPSQPTPPEGEILYVTSSINVEQQEIPNPVVYVPTNLDTEDLLIPTKLGWFGDVFLQWECDENAVMDPDSVEIVGPDTPSAVPIPAYSSMSPPPPTTCRYFVKIGTVPEDGKVIQKRASDVFWQIQLIRGGGTGF